MRITESRLRKVIKSVIKESFPMRRNPEGKMARLFKSFEGIDDIINLLELKDINFSYRSLPEEDDFLGLAQEGESLYEFELSANVKNPYTKSFEKISASSNAYSDDPFNIYELEERGYYKFSRKGIKELFIDAFMYEFFEKMNKIYNPGKMNARRAHKEVGTISDLYDEIARQIHNDFESFLYDILKKTA